MAMANPADYDAIQDLQFASGLTVQPVVATRTEILDGIEELYHTDERMQEFLSQVSDSADFSILSDDSQKIDLDQVDHRNAVDSGSRREDVQSDSARGHSMSSERCASGAGAELLAGPDEG
jgi:Type II secretion system (T2SS), protein E, N-terminal domain